MHSTQNGNPDFSLRKVNYNYSRPDGSSLCDEAYWNWYETTHPQPHSLDQAIEFWKNQRRQLERCQANHPLLYETFLRANQPAEGHPADDTWDYGQLYRLHMIRAHAVQDIPRLDITEEDVDNFLIRIAYRTGSTTTIPPVRNRWINEATHGVKELPPNRRISSSIDR